ncbi:MAG: tetratricopeptide repeat protein [Terracidiphilus sp.]
MVAAGTKFGFAGALALAACLGWRPAFAQNPAGAQSGSQQNPPAANVPQSQQKGNPFPGSTGNVPVLPSGPTANVPEGAPEPQTSRVAFPPRDLDPVRSPDDANPDSGSSQAFSSSLAGVDDLLPAPNQPTANGKKDREIAPIPQESPENDISVGNYYLSMKNWRAALSRFQSALVLEPDNPDMYWGLAESERHIGEFALAREHYLKVLEYDPGSKHAKEAEKALRDPEIAKARPAPAGAANTAHH